MKEIKESIEKNLKRLKEATPDQLIGISTGFEKLDDILGGFVEGTLVTIGGRTGMDKTAFAFNLLIVGNVKIGKHCVIGANSVVTKDIPDFTVAVGSPCRVLKKI